MKNCIIRYFECIINTWKILDGWFHVLTKISLITSTFLSGVAAIGELDPITRTKLGIGSVICNFLAIFMGEMANYSEVVIKEREKMLQEIEKV